MTNYTKTTNFASKDTLPSGNANKIVKGTEIDTEFNNIAIAVATKADSASPTFTGVISVPDGSASAPSITNTGDTNAGLFFSAADTLAFTAGGTAQFTMADGVIAPVTDNDIDLGTSSLKFKDFYIDGIAYLDAINLNGTAITSTAAEINILDGVTSTAAELNILDGVTSTTAELNILDGVTSTAAEINLLDGVTATTTELNYNDTGASVGTVVASKVVTVDANKDVASFRNITLTGELDAGSLDISGDADIDGTLETDALSINGTAVTSTAAELNILDGKAFLDEDNMASNSATGIASQQSIKAYVDSQVTAQDLDFQADSGGALSIDLDSETLTFTGGTGIDTSGSNNAVTFAIDSTVTTLTGSQTLTNKTLTAPTLTGTAVVASLDISGDIDVDGTTNLDVVDIDGAVDMASTLTVGGNVGIGVISPTSALDVATSSGDCIIRLGNGTSQARFAVDNDGPYIYPLTSGDTSLRVFTPTGSQALVIDSSGNVGIGTSSPGAKLEVNGSVITARNNGAAYLIDRSGFSTSPSYAFFGNDTTGISNPSAGVLGFSAAGSEAMRIDSSGNLLVGTTTVNGAGITLSGTNNYGYFSRSGDAALFVNRSTSDGTLIELRKADVAVGSIGARSGDLTIGTGDCGLIFNDGTPIVIPANITTNAVADASIDLGYSSGRFKDLYLSGSVNLVADSSASAEIQLKQTGTGGRDFRISSTGTGYGSAGALIFYDATASSEIARFDSNGRLLVAQTSGVGIGGTPADVNGTEIGKGYINLNRDDTASANQIQFGKNGAVAGRITTTTTTSYVETSDRRVKSNIADAEDCGTAIDLMRVRKFDWTESGEHHPFGMIAQELLEIAPIAVDAPNDPSEMMGIDYSKLVPMLVKEIQSLRARVQQLENN